MATNDLQDNTSIANNWDASTGAYPVSPWLGQQYTVSVAGTTKGRSFRVGDMIQWNGSSWIILTMQSWNPLDITTPVLKTWWDAGDLTPGTDYNIETKQLNGGATVLQDKSGNNIHWGQIASANQPIVMETSLGGFRSNKHLSFNGTSVTKWVETATTQDVTFMPVGNDITIFFTYSWSSGARWDFSAHPTTYRGSTMLWENSPSDRMRIHDGSGWRDFGTPTQRFPLSTVKTCIIRSDGLNNKCEIFLNGILEGTTTAWTNAVALSGIFKVGNHVAVGSSQSFGEFGLYDGKISDTDIEKLDNYLRNGY